MVTSRFQPLTIKVERLDIRCVMDGVQVRRHTFALNTSSVGINLMTQLRALPRKFEICLIYIYICCGVIIWATFGGF